MKVGIFDSGIGGLTVLNEIVKLLPEYDYLYLGDSARAPYGNLSHQEIFEFTRQGIAWLFEHEAGLVIVACNTASSQALRTLQQEWLLFHYPERRVLGVIIPVAEEVVFCSKGVIGIIGTKATIASQAYIRELRKLRNDLKIIQLATPEIVPLIETNAPEQELRRVVSTYLILLKEVRIDTLVLGCTHYPLILPLFEDIMGIEVLILNSPEVVAKKLVSYLAHHPEIEKQLSKNSTHQFFTTGDPEQFASLSKRFFGRSISAQKISF